jgi:PadR family transcriptional regulator AphA
VREWLRGTEPDRTVRDEAALRTFFLWLMDPEDARAHVEAELRAAEEALRTLRATAAARRPATPAERSQRIGLEIGLREAQARADWAVWALERLSEHR